MSQWTNDFVLLQAVGPILRGRSAIADAFRGIDTLIEVLEAGFDIQEVKVLGDYAFQWRTTKACVRAQVERQSVAVAS
jgi:ketosteroid isomerase-like protein